jgi:hypothetical protein
MLFETSSGKAGRNLVPQDKSVILLQVMDGNGHAGSRTVTSWRASSGLEIKNGSEARMCGRVRVRRA